jgi:hypothetical protein
MRNHFTAPQVLIPVDHTQPMREIDALGEDLNRIIEDCNFCLGEAQQEAGENESLAREVCDWTTAECTASEHWAHSDGRIGWRVFVAGCDRAPRLRAHLRGKLLSRGWDHVEVVPA